MSGAWWGFWVLAGIAFFVFAVPIRRARWREIKESSPLLILQRPFAAGELTTEQYEERKAILERDRTAATLPPAPPIVPDGTQCVTRQSALLPR